MSYLLHRDCPANGSLFEASAGRFKEVRWQRSEGLQLDTGLPLSIADVATGWSQLVDFSASDNPTNMGEALGSMYVRPAAD